MTPLQPAEKPGFPRIYRMDERTRHAVNFLVLALAGLFLGGTIFQLARPSSHHGTIADIAFVNLTMSALLVWISSSTNKRVILHEDAIEVAGWFYSRKLSFANIRGRQTTANPRRSGYAYVLLPLDGDERKLVLPRYLHTDQIFRDWIKTIPKIPR